MSNLEQINKKQILWSLSIFLIITLLMFISFVLVSFFRNNYTYLYGFLIPIGFEIIAFLMRLVFLFKLNNKIDRNNRKQFLYFILIKLSEWFIFCVPIIIFIIIIFLDINYTLIIDKISFIITFLYYPIYNFFYLIFFGISNKKLKKSVIN